MAIYAAKNMVNPNYSEVEGRRCYASALILKGRSITLYIESAGQVCSEGGR